MDANYALYNKKTYNVLRQGNQKYLGTYKLEKCSEGFINERALFFCDMEEVKGEIDCLFDVKFYVTYVNKTKTKRGQTRWQVSENVPLHRGFDIEKDEVGIWVNGMSRSNDWVQFDSCFCSKIININECSDFTVKYEYSRKDGVDYEEPLVEEQEVSAEEFKRIMVSYRRQNI